MTDYRNVVLEEGLRRAAGELKIPLAGQELRVLSTTLPSWPSFGDSVEALQELQRDGYRLGILTNTDADLMRGTLAGPLPVEFDEVITAEEVESYKPGDGMFDEFVARHRPSPQDWIHVGSSVWHDCEPAHQRGFRTVFVHRSDNPENNEWIHIGGTDEICADLVLPDLAGLPQGLRDLTKDD